VVGQQLCGQFERARIERARIEPVAPDRVALEAWALAPHEEREGSAALQRRLDSFLTFLGPGGFASPDDVEALESCQQGYAAQPDVAWSDISRGMSRIARGSLSTAVMWPPGPSSSARASVKAPSPAPRSAQRPPRSGTPSLMSSTKSE